MIDDCKIRSSAFASFSCCLISLLLSTLPLQAAVEVESVGIDYIILIDGQKFAQFDTGQEHSRPFFREVRAEDGTILSRPISPPGGDHPHHTGIWVAVDKVNDIGFWHQQGRIKNRSVEVLQNDSDPAIMKVKNDWLDPNGKLILRERTKISIFENRLLIYDIRFTAGKHPVTFGDTEEGFFAFRMADSMREESSGQVVNADGLQTAKGCWGKPSNWVDYSGKVEGKQYGVAIFDHPLNFRPGRYHVRDYGLFTINPFGEHDYTEGRLPAQTVTLKPDASLKLRYGMYFHQGNAEVGNVARVYQEFLQETRVPSDAQREIQFRSTADGTVQPAMFYAPKSEKSDSPLSRPAYLVRRL